MRKVNRVALYEPIKAYTRRAIDELQATCPERPPEILVGLREWQRVAPNAFALRDQVQQYWVSCLQQTEAQRHAWPEYQKVESAIRSDPLLSTQIETLVGTALGAQRQEVGHIADALIWALAQKRGTFTFHEPDFDDEFARLIDRQEATEIEVVVLGPLSGLRGDIFPLLLAPDLEIRDFTDSEIAACLRMGLVYGMMGRSDVQVMDRVVGLRMRFGLPKLVGELGDSAAQSVVSLNEEAFRRAESALEALRTFKEGRVTLTGLIQVIAHGGGYIASGGPAPGTGGFWWGDYQLDDADAEPFRLYWGQLRRAKEKRLIHSAVRRFTGSADRHRADDRLVDLVIAAETLFLGGTDSPQDRGELRFRFALRAAFYLEPSADARRRLYRFMQTSYDARSAIVHGGEPNRKLLRSIDGSEVTLAEYADALEEVLRRAFRKAVADAGSAKGGGPLVDWDELIIGADQTF